MFIFLYASFSHHFCIPSYWCSPFFCSGISFLTPPSFLMYLLPPPSTLSILPRHNFPFHFSTFFFLIYSPFSFPSPIPFRFRPSTPHSQSSLLPFFFNAYLPLPWLPFLFFISRMPILLSYPRRSHPIHHPKGMCLHDIPLLILLYLHPILPSSPTLLSVTPEHHNVLPFLYTCSSPLSSPPQEAGPRWRGCGTVGRESTL